MFNPECYGVYLMKIDSQKQFSTIYFRSSVAHIEGYMYPDMVGTCSAGKSIACGNCLA